LRRMPSSVAELAPLGAYLKYGVLKRGDVLIIEEPETHLHPDKQVKVAELLAMLVNRLELNVLATTHSGVLLAKLSELAALGSIYEGEGVQGLAIDRGKIAIYSFRRGDGVVVEGTEVAEGEGAYEGGKARAAKRSAPLFLCLLGLAASSELRR